MLKIPGSQHLCCLSVSYSVILAVPGIVPSRILNQINQSTNNSRGNETTCRHPTPPEPATGVNEAMALTVWGAAITAGAGAPSGIRMEIWNGPWITRTIHPEPLGTE